MRNERLSTASLDYMYRFTLLAAFLFLQVGACRNEPGRRIVEVRAMLVGADTSRVGPISIRNVSRSLGTEA